MSEKSITRKQLHILKHSLGLNNSEIPYRNHYSSRENCDNYKELLDLEKKEFMTKKIIFDQPCFFVTWEGAEFIGVSEWDFEKTSK